MSTIDRVVLYLVLTGGLAVAFFAARNGRYQPITCDRPALSTSGAHWTYPCAVIDTQTGEVVEMASDPARSQ